MLYTLRRKHRRTWWALLIRGLLGLAVGIFILARPIASLDAIALIVAIWALLSGIIEIVHALETRPIIKSWWILVLGGLVSICFGMAAIYFYPELSLAFMTVWVGFLLATSGITVVYASVQMMNAGLSWIWTSIWGVLSVLASVFAFTHPAATLAAILDLLAVMSIASGSVLLIAAWRIRAFTKHLVAIVRCAAPPTSGRAVSQR